MGWGEGSDGHREDPWGGGGEETAAASWTLDVTERPPETWWWAEVGEPSQGRRPGERVETHRDCEKGEHLRGEELMLTDGTCQGCWRAQQVAPGKGKANSFSTEMRSVSPGLREVPGTVRCHLSHGPGRDF